jgi:hypothetical protein
MFRLCVFVLMFSTNAMALEMRSKKALSTSQAENRFTAELKSGFHFNEKAPNGVTSASGLLKPKELTPTKITFEFETALKEAAAQIYVCDDAVTFCEVHNIPLSTGLKNKKSSCLLISRRVGARAVGGLSKRSFLKPLLKPFKKILSWSK